MEDVCYNNQEIFCKENKVPLFAFKTCSHSYSWCKGREYYGKTQTLGEMLTEMHGERAPIIAASTHITGCPICGRTWCD